MGVAGGGGGERQGSGWMGRKRAPLLNNNEPSSREQSRIITWLNGYNGRPDGRFALTTIQPLKLFKEQLVRTEKSWL
jgi:hypothetical protein